MKPKTDDEIFPEKKNVDIVIKGASGGHVLTENKFKDIPNSDQLARYNHSFSEIEKRILLALVSPQFEVGSNGWDVIRYSDFARRLNCRLFKQEIVDPTHAVFIQNYCEMVTDICEIFDASIEKIDDAVRIYLEELEESCRKFENEQ